MARTIARTIVLACPDAGRCVFLDVSMTAIASVQLLCFRCQYQAVVMKVLDATNRTIEISARFMAGL